MNADQPRHGGRHRVRHGFRRVGIGVTAAVVAAGGSLLALHIRSDDRRADQAAPAGSVPSTSGVGGPSTANGQGTDSAGREFPADARFDYQIGSVYEPAAGVSVVFRDSSERPAPAAYNICYVNGFQSQPGTANDEGSSAWFLKNRPELLLRNPTPNVPTNPASKLPPAFYVDAAWPDEILFDITKPANLDPLAEIVGRRIAECARKKFDAVELDNLDVDYRALAREEDRAGVAAGKDIETFTAPKLITRHQILAFAQKLITKSHALGLKAGQKNALELGRSGKEAGFDFAVVESCGEYDECKTYGAIWDSKWVNVEYTEKDFKLACAAVGSRISVIRRDSDLTAPGSRTYVYEEC